MQLGNSKGPLFLHLSTTLEGLFSIRVYRAQDRFTHVYKNAVDENHKALYSLMFGIHINDLII